MSAPFSPTRTCPRFECMDEPVGAAILKSPNGAPERMNGLPGKTDVKSQRSNEDPHHLITALIGRWTAILEIIPSGAVSTFSPSMAVRGVPPAARDRALPAMRACRKSIGSRSRGFAVLPFRCAPPGRCRSLVRALVEGTCVIWTFTAPGSGAPCPRRSTFRSRPTCPAGPRPSGSRWSTPTVTPSTSAGSTGAARPAARPEAARQRSPHPGARARSRAEVTSSANNRIPHFGGRRSSDVEADRQHVQPAQPREQVPPHRCSSPCHQNAIPMDARFTL